jgi:[acyl-carrier-protein] S-malonyltransferase
VDDWRRALADQAWSQRNDNAQTLLTGLALAAWRQLSPLVSSPAAVAGYSVGELSAFSVAGVIAPETAAALAPLRAEAMDRCAAGAAGGLLAVSGLAQPALERLCAGESVVLGGPRPALDEAERAASHAGAKCTRLGVSVASHTPWMRGAAESFARTLADVPFHAPTSVLFSNARDRVSDAPSARTALADQICNTVRWDECMENVAARRIGCVLEIGPALPRHPGSFLRRLPQLGSHCSLDRQQLRPMNRPPRDRSPPIKTGVPP